MQIFERNFITRRIPAAVFSYLAGHCVCEMWPHEDTPVPRPVLLEKAARVEGLYTMLTDRIDAEVLQAAPRLRVSDVRLVCRVTKSARANSSGREQ